jgi:iron-sulfur cluster repair protein YtfE (RIC family)
MPIGTYDVVSEHHHIHQLVGRLEAWVERRQQEGNAWLSGLCNRLEQLNLELGPHFHGEETVVFADIRSRLPRLVDIVDRLIEQHRRMEKDFSRIGEQAKNLNLADNQAWSELAEQITKSLRLLKVHEQQETELILTAYGQDLGEGD